MLNELKNRGVKDILVLCADGLSGIKEAIAAAFPKTEYQLCIVSCKALDINNSELGSGLWGTEYYE